MGLVLMAQPCGMVSLFLGYNNIHDLVENEKAQKESDIMKDAVDSYNLSLACKRFPSITLGSSPSVVLYDGTKSLHEIESIHTGECYNQLPPGAMGMKWLYPDDLCETWPSLYPAYPDMNSFVKEDNSNVSTSAPEYPTKNCVEVSDSSETRNKSVGMLKESSDGVWMSSCRTLKESSPDGSFVSSASIKESVSDDSWNGSPPEAKKSSAPIDEENIGAWKNSSAISNESVVIGLTSSSTDVNFNSYDTFKELPATVNESFTATDKPNDGALTKATAVMKEPIAAEPVNPFKDLEESIASPLQLVLDTPIEKIRGFSKRQWQQLEKCGFHTLRKLLHHFPRTYANSQNALVGIDDGQYLIFVGKILSSRGVKASFSFSFLEVVVGCDIADTESTSEDVACCGENKRSIYLHLKKFFRGARFTTYGFLRSLEEKHREGDIVCVSGKARPMRSDHYEIREYSLDVLDGEHDLSLRTEGRPHPIYPSKGSLNSNHMRDIIWRSVQELPVNIDPIPDDIVKDFGLVSLYDAYMGIHRPKDLYEADSARKRLIFDEFFYLQLARLFQMLEGLGSQIEKDGLLDKYRKPELNAVFVEGWSNLTKKFLSALPYSLTPSQLTAVSEIIWDLQRPVPMNRLLQGDVGCGKTIVAFLACVEVIGSGYQAAFMVPTELLAVQHYEQFLEFLGNMDTDDPKPSVALLTGSTPARQARMIRQGLQNGDISIVIGTHSLIAERVEFLSLRIAVVDEQHRFGVVQRGRFNSKLYYTSISSKLATGNAGGSTEADTSMAPHVLAMSATPIPRTLALALYGDMSLTQITDLPPGRIPVDTHIVQGDDTGLEKVYQMMQTELEDGGKIFLVYPIIKQSEQLPQLHAAAAEIDTVSQKFSDFSCGLLHGKMKSDEKDDALGRFRSGETHILLSTQVIEIGVDVPDASMMVVMNAERFGIAQLHQLRGRVGRGERKSKCILVPSTENSLNRLKVLGDSSDGFYLANMDLILRGPGDLLGKKQSGHLPEFPIARLEYDGNILQDAHHAALRVLGTSHNLEQFPALKAELSMRQPLSLLGD
uniref:DNA 3'-5' helicase n=1 Tax=Kalanchoe fedtschenkoi TaxID=63787 RepID=A0A7N0UCN8_KALFE